jgi:hypothetical protein
VGQKSSRCCAKKRCATCFFQHISGRLHLNRAGGQAKTVINSNQTCPSCLRHRYNGRREVVFWKLVIMHSVAVVLKCVVQQDDAYAVRHKLCRSPLNATADEKGTLAATKRGHFAARRAMRSHGEFRGGTSWESLVDHRHQIYATSAIPLSANPRNLMCLLRERPQKQAYVDPRYLIYIGGSYNGRRSNADSVYALRACDKWHQTSLDRSGRLSQELLQVACNAHNGFSTSPAIWARTSTSMNEIQKRETLNIDP